MLIRRRFTYCAMVIPFILHSLPCSSIFLQQGVNLTFEGDDSLLWLLLITSQKHLACTSYNYLQLHNVFVVFACTLLHREL